MRISDWSSDVCSSDLAVQRLLAPVAVAGWTMLAVAGLGLVVNLAALFILHGGDRRNLNLRGATVHVLGALLGSAAAVHGAVVILPPGWLPIDHLLSLLFGLLVLGRAWPVCRDPAHLLLEK